ncbi:MAG: 2,3,4,5-tetrahydropyridine-2,6-dicarboxylate N-succinyltransferase [Bdellovibrionaceae bacterium]|nr:2,3,4,5-tetrahydropyridine-2,6-dicarboxylate N-succinyltransferase [Pseudobdellovibrionaceae bacterium]
MILETVIQRIDKDLKDGMNINDLTSEDTSAIREVIQLLDHGKLRVAEKIPGATGPQSWKVNEWVKKAILHYFRIQKMQLMETNEFNYFDKIAPKKWTGAEGVRVVPPAMARYGSFLNSGCIMMPSYVNIGAYVDSGTMVDTWATVGSCGQIGKNVHLSGGVGIGGVLEPTQAAPVIIEDSVFVGSRCIIVEGAFIEEGAVIGAGVTITSSTKILDVSGPEVKEYKAYVPKNSVVIPGTINKKFAAGEYGVNCALIIGQRKPSTDLKTSLNDTLRDFQISV